MLALATFMKSGRWMSKQVPLPVSREERLYVIQLEGFDNTERR